MKMNKVAFESFVKHSNLMKITHRKKNREDIEQSFLNAIKR